MDNGNELIVAKNLSGGYAGRVVWERANFSIGRGEFVAVLGPNGAGKTTLFKLLLGLQAPIAGELKIFGKIPARGNPKIGYVPQRHSFDGETNIEVLELVRLGINGTHWGFGLDAKKDRDAAMEALHKTGAEELAHRSLSQLSGGELQRVFLAEALVGNPDLLLLDEPLANLDIRRERELVDLIRRIVDSQKITVLLIAHNINPLLPALDRVMYLAGGSITTGAPHEVLTSESLSRLYGTNIEVLRDSQGRVAVLGIEEIQHHE